ncbi:MAG: arginine--tRNA ligase [Dehalococcoidia bacterium]|nr:arginine--tRNA ligase [Dehalococcoidia bacterium]
MFIKQLLNQRLRDAFAAAQAQGLLPEGAVPEDTVERPQNPEHGDFASTLPMKAARTLRMAPMKIAQAIAPLVGKGAEIAEVAVAPPGFLNIRLHQSWLQRQVEAVRREGERFGNAPADSGEKVQVEFVSVNPTGPIHVGHARGAVLGSTLANVLDAAGYQVSREYYVNDAGTQMDLFYRSLYVRYQQALGQAAELPPEGYRGQYLATLGQQLAQQHGDRYLHLPEREAVGQLGAIGLEEMLAAIRADLEAIRVTFDIWFRERTLFADGTYDKAMGLLRDGGHVEQREGATWFTSTRLGDDRDSVLVRSAGTPTYFASDAAYHYNKFKARGFERVIDIWGADHQGHVNRVKAVVEALGTDPGRLTIIIAQLVTLRRKGEVVRASKRTGELVTLRELVEEVGPDACRYFFLARSPEAQMEFDLDLAVQQSQENPVYYLQYAHARIAGILRNAQERGIQSFEDGDVALLTAPEELDLIRRLLELPELMASMARSLEPHHLPHYALELATAFHWFYDRCRVITEDEALTKARLKLMDASRVGLARCLSLMGMSAPERM